MKIAYILSLECVISGDSNGVKMQAKIWAECLKKMGHEVALVNPWEHYRWIEFDVIHIFGAGLWLHEFVRKISLKNNNVVISPIIDTIKSVGAYRMASYWGFPKLRLYSSNFVLRETKRYVKKFYTRSQHESDFLIESYGIDEERIVKIPLSCRFDGIKQDVQKEDFCFHVSSIVQPRKNVVRLIKAANKYGFRLVLAGNKGTQDEYKYLEKIINGNPNISVLGFVSKEQLIELYDKAKVFALPSITEGVGLVALEAAARGCDIVMTNLGGPKEYYADLAYLVNPFSVDEIGRGVINALGTTKQPQLKQHILSDYSLEKLTQQLLDSYKNI